MFCSICGAETGIRYGVDLRRGVWLCPRCFRIYQSRARGVKVIGAWDNADDTDEGFLITEYRDEAHYEKAVAKMREDPMYQDLSKTFEGTREMLEVVTLKLLPGSPT